MQKETQKGKKIHMGAQKGHKNSQRHEKTGVLHHMQQTIIQQWATQALLLLIIILLFAYI